ncbi:MAG: dTDP-4-dehydrorhamnose 3,5-epimerase family protein [Lentisphaerae bacterium]|nr:dTDP-4-dehydrorhamnose 3,5-epimerase family protein [Lentisphaerota bacterium]
MMGNSELIAAATQDERMATQDRQILDALPHGALIREVQVFPDDRGMLFEVFDEEWQWHPEPLTRVYCSTILPGVGKGWNIHLHHEDRYTVIHGEMDVAMYDGRENSPTFGQCFHVLLSERRRRSLTVPIEVWHCDYNVGNNEVMFINCPTGGPYDVDRPDKLRLPLYTQKIPYALPPGLRGY